MVTCVHLKMSLKRGIRNLNFEQYIRSRYEHFKRVLNKIETENEGGLEGFSRGYEKFGFVVHEDRISYREWAPGAIEAYLIGDFSNSHALTCVM